ncbi:hypothetical protein CKF54_03950 [Psittacicella hinzii]|uniref:Uncharacterized protein n=1 Tax=Psittacicella hinzii TaxID=2028575 RepID=A0A3A1Y9P1_9GAMM|nr:hypothetical protein [Psittacicella hinzii]RIY32854.1 hypothetical protein CKF54_03950 [Psittacicella hinzii]
MQRVTYTDFFHLANPCLQEQSYLNGNRLYYLTPEQSDYLRQSPLEGLRRTLAWELPLELTLLESMLKQAHKLLFTLPYQRKGEFAHAQGAQEFFLYSSQKGLSYYLAHTPKQLQAHSVNQRLSSGLLFMAANLLMTAWEVRSRVQVCIQEQELGLFNLDLEAWYTSQVPDLQSLEIAWYSPKVQEASTYQALFGVYRDFLLTDEVQKTLTCLVPNWQQELFALFKQEDKKSLLYQSLRYGKEQALGYSKTQALLEQYKQEQQSYGFNSQALLEEVLLAGSKLQGKQHLASYLQHLVSLWQIHLHDKHFNYKQIINILRWQMLADHLDLQWQQLEEQAFTEGFAQLSKGLEEAQEQVRLASLEAKQGKQDKQAPNLGTNRSSNLSNLSSDQAFEVSVNLADAEACAQTSAQTAELASSASYLSSSTAKHSQEAKQSFGQGTEQTTSQATLQPSSQSVLQTLSQGTLQNSNHGTLQNSISTSKQSASVSKEVKELDQSPKQIFSQTKKQNNASKRSKKEFVSATLLPLEFDEAPVNQYLPTSPKEPPKRSAPTRITNYSYAKTYTSESCLDD